MWPLSMALTFRGYPASHATLTVRYQLCSLRCGDSAHARRGRSPEVVSADRTCHNAGIRVRHSRVMTRCLSARRGVPRVGLEPTLHGVGDRGRSRTWYTAGGAV